MIKTFNIPGPLGKLEALIETVDHPQAPWALLLHPHPLYCGTMHNKVISTTAKACREAGIHTLRFNFKGVGQSESDYTDLKGASEDAQAAIRWLITHHGKPPQYLIGFSFGSYVAAEIAQPTMSVILIAPPVERLPFNLQKLPHSTTIIQGNLDAITSPKATRRAFEARIQSNHYIEIPNASHFFDGQLHTLHQALKHILTLKPE